MRETCRGTGKGGIRYSLSFFVREDVGGLSTQRPMKTRSQSLFLVVFAAFGLIAFAQSRGGNWPTYGGDAQRSGWEAADAAISKDTVKNFRLLWKTKLETALRGMRPV